MKKLLYLILFLGISLTSFAQQKQELKVLYVGGSSDLERPTPESVQERFSAFEEYLKQYFTQVTAIRSSQYKTHLSADYDVTIFDGMIPRKQQAIWRKGADGETKYFNAISIADEFNHPAILIANMGDLIGRGLGTKTDWYCLCLDADAHHINLEHPIFKGPFKTDITLTDKPTPDAAFSYEYSTGKLPQTLPMWKVQTKGYMNDKGFRIGMVSRPAGFTDSPETEIISSGVCAKSIDAVAIGRHGNFFFWGFSASPKYMTEEAKDVFANAVVYTSTLKGQKIIAKKYYDRAATKAYIKELTHFASEEAYQKFIKIEEEYYQETVKLKQTAIAKKEKGEKLSEDETYALNTEVPSSYEPISFEDYMKKRLKDNYKTFGTDYKAYHKYLQKNEPYFYGAAMFYKLQVDEDAKSWKIPNSDVRLIEKAITTLEKGKKQEEIAKAKRILDRYTLCTFSKPAQWREWFNKYKEKLFFTESGGYLFLVNDMNPQTPGNDYKAERLHTAAANLALPETSDTEPVAVAAQHITIDGGRQFILVKFKIESGYHIYGKVSKEDPFIPTQIELILPQGYTQEEMIIPAGSPLGRNGTTQFEEEATFIVPIFGDSKEPIQINIKYQCCDTQICFPPVEKTLEIPSPAAK